MYSHTKLFLNVLILMFGNEKTGIRRTFVLDKLNTHRILQVPIRFIGLFNKNNLRTI